MDFLKTLDQNLKKTFQPPTPTVEKKPYAPFPIDVPKLKTPITPTPIIKPLDKSVPPPNAAGFLADMVRAFPRFVAGTGASITQSLMGQKETPYEPTGKVQKFILGDKPIKSITQQYEEASKNYTSDSTGLNPWLTKSLILGSIVGSAAGEALPVFGGAEKKLTESLFKKGVDDLVRLATETKSPAQAYTLLRESGISHDIAIKKSPILATTTDKKLVKTIIDDTAAEQSQITKQLAETRLSELDAKVKSNQILNHAELTEKNFIEKNINKPSELFNAYKDISPMNGPVDDALINRKYIDSALKAESIADDVKREVGYLDNSYTAKSNIDLEKRAVTRVIDDFEEAKRFAFENNTDEAVATRIAIEKAQSSRILEEADPVLRSKLAKEAAETINKHARLATEEGRAVQANAILNKQSPEGMLRTTSKAIADYNKTSKVKIPELSGKDVENILDQGRKIEKMPNGFEKELAKNRLARQLEEKVPSAFWKKVTNVWKAGLLTGIKTSGVNIQSNFWNGVAEQVKNIPATGIDMATSLVTGNRTKALTLRGLFKGSAEGVKKGWNYLKTGVSGEAGESSLEFNKIHFDSKPGKILEAYADTVYRVLGSQDMPFFYGSFRRSLAEQALVTIKNEGKVFASGKDKTKFIQDFMDNPPPEAMALADMDAKMATFKNDTELGKMAQGIQNSGPLGTAAQLTILPFAKTPSAVAMQMLNYSPAGALTTFYKSFKGGQFNQKEFAEGLGRVVTGTGALWLGSKLYEDGLISLGYPKDEKERAQWEATGRTPNSIKIGNAWYPLVQWGPQGSLLGVGGYIQKGKEETGSMAGGVANGLFGGLKGLTEQTFLTGVKGLIDVINDPEKKWEDFVARPIASIVPTIVSDVTQSLDKYQRKSSGSVLGAFKARIPGLRETLPEKLDVWGQPIERNRSAVATAISPIRLSNTRESALNTEVERLEQLGEDIRPTKVDNKIKNVPLDEEEHFKYQRFYGNLLTKAMTQVLKSKEYQSLDPEEQAKEWNKATKQLKSEVNEIALQELMKRRYDLPEDVDIKYATDLINELYKTNDEKYVKFKSASLEKQKEFLRRTLSK